jgi:hypothetical protein
MAKPPLKLTEYVSKMPRRCHALIVILDGGKVENPEFVCYRREGDNDECFTTAFSKWKRKVLPTLKRSNVEFWELHNGELTNVNLLNR